MEYSIEMSWTVKTEGLRPYFFKVFNIELWTLSEYHAG